VPHERRVFLANSLVNGVHPDRVIVNILSYESHRLTNDGGRKLGRWPFYRFQFNPDST
jgi:hypothetical protein